MEAHTVTCYSTSAILGLTRLDGTLLTHILRIGLGDIMSNHISLHLPSFIEGKRHDYLLSLSVILFHTKLPYVMIPNVLS